MDLKRAAGICRTMDFMRFMFKDGETDLMTDLVIATMLKELFNPRLMEHSDWLFLEYDIGAKALDALASKGYSWHYNSSQYLPWPKLYSAEIALGVPSYYSHIIRDVERFAKYIAKHFDAVFEEFSFEYVEMDTEFIKKSFLSKAPNILRS